MFKGHCTCNFVSFEMTREPMFVHCCHCTWCQRETGSAFVINAIIESANINITAGEVEKVTTPTEGPAPQIIHRCPKCRVALWSNYGGTRDVVRFVRVGTLETPAILAPDVHIYVRSKLPWVNLADGKPQFSEFYEYQKLWPADKFERLQKVRVSSGAK